MMKIEKQTESEMSLKESGIWHLVIGFIFAAFGAVMLFMPEIFGAEPPPWFVGALFLLIGLGVIFLVEGTRIVEINKATKKLSVSGASILRKSKNDYDLGLVEEIEARRYYTTTGTSRNRTTKLNIDVAAVLKGDNTVVLTRSSSSGLMSALQSGESERSLAKKVADFIGVPFKDRRPPTVEETLGAISKGIEKGMQKSKK